MTPERWRRIDELLDGALDRPAGERAAYLEGACGGDEGLRREVEQLLEADRRAEGFIEAPAFEVAAGLLVGEQAELAAGQLVGHYRVVSRVGSGGMGDVYLAEDTRLGRNVALKLLPASLTADARLRARFLREARLASALDHPNVCTVHEVGHASGHFFIAMQYVEGVTLRELVGSAPLSPASMLSIALQAADALSAAHERGIVHRDVKSSNIVVGPRGQVKVLDFGLAKLVDGRGASGAGSKLTMTGAVLGTPAYMSPEQARGEPADHRSDIFSLGVVIYEMATGRTPFEARSQAETMNAVIHQPHTPAAELNAEVPADLSAAVDRALAKEPADRYQAVAEMLVDLRRVARAAGLLGPHDSGDATVPRVPPRESGPERPSAPRGPLSRRALALGALGLLAALLLGLGVREWRAAAPGAGDRGPIASLAVLPLENLSGDPAEDYFADGMTEALINELAKIRALRVISRTSAMQYRGARKTVPEIGRELGVDAVVEGSVLRSGDRVRITVQLVRAATDEPLWAESYERDPRDVLSLQSDVGRAIAREIQVNVTPQEQRLLASARPLDPEAHEAYLKGLYFFNRGINEQAGELLDRSAESFARAVEIDPGYAQAYAALARAYHWHASTGLPELYPKAKAAALRALELDETLGEAHAALAFTITYLDRDWAGAEREYRRAIELNPGDSGAHHGYAILLWVTCRHDEAIAEIRRAEELDPLTLPLKANIAAVYATARDYDRAVEKLRHVLELSPDDPFLLANLGKVYVQKGMHEQGIAEIRRAAELSGESPEIRAILAWAYAASGRRREAGGLLDELKGSAARGTIPPGLPSIAVTVAQAYAALGERDQAFAWLERAYEERSDSLLDYLKCSPELDGLRSDPRFAELMRRTGLPSA